jgi:hypothetical protein
MMTIKAVNGQGLATEVRRQIGAAAMTRFLRTLPTFRAESDIPDRFTELLQRLDAAENDNADCMDR